MRWQLALHCCVFSWSCCNFSNPGPRQVCAFSSGEGPASAGHPTLSARGSTKRHGLSLYMWLQLVACGSGLFSSTVYSSSVASVHPADLKLRLLGKDSNVTHTALLALTATFLMSNSCKLYILYISHTRARTHTHARTHPQSGSASLLEP